MNPVVDMKIKLIVPVEIVISSDFFISSRYYQRSCHKRGNVWKSSVYFLTIFCGGSFAFLR